MKFRFELSLITLLMLIQPAQASLVRQVTQSQAQGAVGSGATVTVWPGSGTNIDFTLTGEVVQRVWLDDPSFLTIDFDGNLCGHRGGCNEDSGASIIHLRRVTGIRFPNLPQTNATLLTVITNSSSGKKTYLFRVTYGRGEPQYASVSVTPDAPAGPQAGIVVSGNRTANWDDLERGLTQAIDQKLLAPDSPVVVRVQSFLALVRNGHSLSEATRSADVSMAILSRLAQMGYRMIAPVAPASAVAPATPGTPQTEEPGDATSQAPSVSPNPVAP